MLVAEGARGTLVPLVFLALLHVRQAEASQMIGGYVRADLTDSPLTSAVSIAFDWSFTIVAGSADNNAYMTVCSSGTACPVGGLLLQLVTISTSTSTVCQLNLETDSGVNNNFYIPYANISNRIVYCIFINTSN